MVSNGGDAMSPALDKALTALCYALVKWLEGQR